MTIPLETIVEEMMSSYASNTRCQEDYVQMQISKDTQCTNRQEWQMFGCCGCSPLVMLLSIEEHFFSRQYIGW